MRRPVAERTNSHPDEDFNNYILTETDEFAYTPEEAAIRNNLMEQYFDVCEAVGQDVYSIIFD